MSEPLEDSITHLRDQSLQLNDITDRATAAVRRVESFLNQECRLGLAVYVPIPPAPGKGLPAPDAPLLQLGYARGGDRYRIVVRALAKDRPEGERGRDEQVAWSECPRALKIEAFQQLPALLTALHSHLAEIIQRADAALVAAQRITDVLGEAPPDTDDDGDDRERGHHHHHEHGHHHHGHHEHGHHGPHERGERGACDERGRGERGDERGREERGRGERGGDERGHGRHKHRHGEGRGWDKA